MILDRIDSDENIERNYADEIDLKPIFKTLNKEKKLISAVSIIAFLITFISIYFSKRQWSGEFEIVLRTMPNLTRLSSSKNQALNPFDLLTRGVSNQNTQLRILQSPSVLLEVFEFAKSKKINTEKIDDLKFRDWKKQLKFENPKKTVVLKLTYIDNDKNLVLPILNKISSVYQEYSGKERKRQIELGKQYFSSQLNSYRKKSSESLEKAQQFANKYNLSTVQVITTNKNNENKNSNSASQSININEEKESIKAKNEIKMIDKQIKTFKSYDLDSTDLIYLASALIDKKDFNVLQEMNFVENELNYAKNTYKEDDKYIKELILKKRSLLKTARTISLNILSGMKDDANTRLKVYERPKSVFIEFRRLLENASRDKLTLQKLDADFRALSLEEARLEDPWELITRPTLLPSPIPRNTLFRSLIAGFAAFIASSFYLLINYYRKGFIRSEYEVSSIVNCEYHENLLKSDKTEWDQTLEFFIRKTSIKSSKNLAFYIVADKNNLEIKELIDKLKKLIPEEKFKICKDINEIFDYSSFIFIVSIDVTNKDELKDLNKKIMQLNKNINSYITLS